SQMLMTNNQGCDSLIITTTSLLASDTTYLQATTCDPQFVGTSQMLMTNNQGCDSLIITTTSLLASDTTYLQATTCDIQFVGTSQMLMTNNNGCDSLIITTTSLLAGDTTTLLFTTCDSTQAGTTTQVLTNIDGCDSTIISITQLLPTQITFLNAITCDINMVGTVTDTFTTSNGCDSLVMTTTTLSSLPFVTMTSDTAICENTPVQLFGTGGVSYNWSSGTGLSDSTIANPIATIDSTTTYVLTIANADGCTATDSVTITVVPTPILTLPDSIAICQGDTTQVIVSGVGTFTWATAPGISSTTVPNPLLFPVSTTLYVLTVTNIAGCSTTDSVLVIVENNPIITISSAVDICEGESVPLSATGGVNYLWTPSSSLNNDTIPNPIATPSMTTTYQVQVSSPIGCTSFGAVTITVNDTITPYIVQTNDSILTAFPNNGTGYTWFYADTFFNAGSGFLIYNVGTNPVNIDSAGYYRVRVTDINGCTYESETVFMDVVPTEQPLSLQNLTLMPNPTRNYVDIRFDNIKSQPVEIVLYNKTGQRVYQQMTNIGVGNHTERLDLGNLPAGVYMVRIAGEDFILNRQLLIMGD
ncbi:MAG: T9SS type A sorting domain-containing protein, partial [Saprospiraceae bacterium]